MKKDLVSIVTPCHNSAEFIETLFNSILNQTYKYVEMFCIDNDSTDDTAEIIKSYIPKFNDKGYKLTYIHQGDMGPSGGCKTGLQHVQGEFLLIPDSDDWYKDDDFIEIMVNKFQTLPDEYAMIRCQDEMVEQYTNRELGILGKNMIDGDMPHLFEDCFYGENQFVYAGIGFMFKTEKLRELTGMDIYTQHDTGPNRQIMLPLLYEYKCYTIAKPMVCYFVRKTSISHGDYSKYSIMINLMKNERNYITAILDTIPSMSDSDRARYLKNYLSKAGREGLIYTVNARNKDDFEWFYKEVHENDKIRFNDKILKFIVGKNFLTRLYNLLRRISLIFTLKGANN